MIRFLHSRECMGTREYVGAKIERSPRKSAKKTDLRCMTLYIVGRVKLKEIASTFFALRCTRRRTTPFEGKLKKT